MEQTKTTLRKMSNSAQSLHSNDSAVDSEAKAHLKPQHKSGSDLTKKATETIAASKMTELLIIDQVINNKNKRWNDLIFLLHTEKKCLVIFPAISRRKLSQKSW